MKLEAKKSLGQHFLRSKTALKEILTAGALSPGETVLEIGPGEGVLTAEMLAGGARVVAIETDKRAIELLAERFKNEIKTKQLLLLEGDIREEEVQRGLFLETSLGNNPYKLIANIPYYITGYLFRLFLETLRQPTLIVFLVQKEVAEQIVSRDGKEGLLSLSIKVFGTPRYIAKVKREAFTPPPKVDSAIIAVEEIHQLDAGDMSTVQYFKVLKAGLGAKRKMLLGNLAVTLAIPRAELGKIFSDLAIPPSARGEDLPVEKWIALARKLHTFL